MKREYQLSVQSHAWRKKLSASSHTARAQLRQATADIHETLHQHPGFGRLMSGSLTLAEYFKLLARLYGFYNPLEYALSIAQPRLYSPIDLKAREKAHLLRADLITIGMSESKIDALPLCRTIPKIWSSDHIMGCLYVVEGAGLGGSVMAGRLNHLLGGGNPAGRQFFLGRIDPDPLPWTKFCQLLEAYSEEGDLAEILVSARRTFRAMARWLNKGYANV
jgi:heme oxygenase